MCPIPAERECIAEARLDHRMIGNLSLLMDRYNPRVDEPRHHEHDAKDWAFEKRIHYTFTESALFTRAFHRWKAAWEAIPDVELVKVRTTTPLLLGTGNANLHEAGVQFLKPWGVPYLPGSSLKGALSSWLVKNGGPDWKADHIHKSAFQTEIFGGMYEDQAYAGSVLFGDAWLDSESSGKDPWFIQDIITVHHQNYYGQTGEKPYPHGMEDPTPISMSPLRTGLVFYVVLQGPEPVRNFLKIVLADLLTHQGLGAKTAVGYGRFEMIKGENDTRKEAMSIKNWDDLEALLNSTPGPVIETLAEEISKRISSFSIKDLARESHSKSVKHLRAHLPIKHFAWLLEQNPPESLKAAKKVRDDDANVKGVQPTPEDPDVQSIFSFCLKLAAKESKEVKGSWFEAFAYTWEQTNYTEEQLLELVINAKKHVWPPLDMLRPYLETRDDLGEETKEDILTFLDETLS